SMGGLYVDYDQMTTIPGLFAAGECDYSQHGGNRLGANSLLSAIYGGMVAGPKAVEYVNELETSYEDIDDSVYDKYAQAEQEKFNKILAMDGEENAYVIHKDLCQIITENDTVVRHNDKLLDTDKKVVELMERDKNINIRETQKWSNQAGFFTRQLWNM